MDESAEHRALSEALSDAFVQSASAWTVDSLAEAGASCLDRWPDWMVALAMRVVAVYRMPPAGSYGLLQLIAGFLEEHSVLLAENYPPRILRLLSEPPAPAVAPPPFTHDWAIADVASVSDLADRLELSQGQLDWLADARGLERSVTREQLRNYRYRTIPRRGGVPRVIEAPKARLKEIQRWILREILDEVPAHDAAHGFVRGRSAVTHAAHHADQPVVLRLDLKDFFASVRAGRVYGVWKTLGYSSAVSHALTALTTNTVPASVWDRVGNTIPDRAFQARFELGRRLATPHLPQGAPSSPALANLAAFKLDQRLSGLARASGFRYSRYADDLVFSGSGRLIRGGNHFESVATAIIRAEGFTVNQRKTAAQSAGGRQTVCGVVVNIRTNVPRAEYEQLKATLHNAAVHGAAAQNRDGVSDFRSYLRGRISWVEALNPERGRRLRAVFETIDWS